MSEYVFRYSSDQRLDDGELMDDGETLVSDYFAEHNLDHYGTLHDEIVRCRDCKRYHPKEGQMLACKFEYEGFTQWRSAEPDGFCAWAEKKVSA